MSPDEKSKTSAENLGEHKSGDPDPWVFLPGTGIVRQQAARRFAKGYMRRRGRKDPDLPHRALYVPAMGWGHGTVNIAFPTENELNITLTAPIQDPSLDPIFPHLSLKRAK